MALQFVITISFLFLLTSGLAEAAPIAQSRDCATTCGNVTDIPYPFGIRSAGCYMDDWFEIVCNKTGAFLKKINMEVLSISINGTEDGENNTLLVKSSAISLNSTGCPGISSDGGGVNITGSPFVFSDLSNKFIAAGCNNSVTIKGTDPIVAGCTSNCDTSKIDEDNFCSGYDCCNTQLPTSGLQLFNVDFRINATDEVTDVSMDNKKFQKGCRYALLGRNSWVYSTKTKATDPFPIEKIMDFVPVVLAWRIYNWTNNSKEVVDSFNNRSDFECRIYPTHEGANKYRLPYSFTGPEKLDVGEFLSFSCVCGRGYEGNPYLSTGCEDINECENSTLNSCLNITEECQNTNGSFKCNTLPNTKENTLRTIIIGICTSFGGMSLLIFTWWSYKAIKKRNEINLKNKFFKKNGGLLLQQQLHASENNVQNTKLFTKEELEKATDQFNESRILGKGGQGTVYKGMLIDGRIVAIKKCNDVEQSYLEQFINEIIILSQINHRNVVKLLGCCLEIEVPLLVYEFISNGTLSQYLHEECEDFPLTWDQRLRIASEVAGALSYLHSAASLPIIHRDIKSSNILLDDKYGAKIADFGTSRTVAIGKTHLTTLVYGTFGYLDPEYFLTSQLTDKSDVYGFGVVLAELLTGEKPISSVRTDEGKSLAKYFILSIENNSLFDILDDQVKRNGDEKEIKVVANLAKRCLHMEGRRRPTMGEVTKEIEEVRKVFSGQENDEELDNVRMEEIEPWNDVSTSTPSILEMVQLRQSLLTHE